MKGIFSVFDHKKYVLMYTIIGLSFYALMADKITGADFSQIITIAVGVGVAAGSFDKSQWRKDD